MKSFIAIFALVAVAAAVDVPRARAGDAAAEIIEQIADVFPDQYQYSYKTSNGIAAQESGSIVNAGKESEGIAVSGSNSYINDEGQTVQTTYTADQNGYVAQGAHLPVGPEIPEYILRSLAFIAAHPPKEEKVLG